MIKLTRTDPARTCIASMRWSTATLGGSDRGRGSGTGVSALELAEAALAQRQRAKMRRGYRLASR